MFLQVVLTAEDRLAHVTGEPMLLLFVPKAKFPVVGGPSSKTPAAFNLVDMVDTVIKVIPYTVVAERAAAAVRHVWAGFGKVVHESLEKVSAGRRMIKV